MYATYIYRIVLLSQYKCTISRMQKFRQSDKYYILWKIMQVNEIIKIYYLQFFGKEIIIL